VGRNELPDLPSSRRAIMAAPGTTLAMPYFQSIEKNIDMDTAIEGELIFMLSVRKDDTVKVQPSQRLDH